MSVIYYNNKTDIPRIASTYNIPEYGFRVPYWIINKDLIMSNNDDKSAKLLANTLKWKVSLFRHEINLENKNPKISHKLPNVVCVKVADIRPKYNTLKQWMEDPNNVYIGRRGVLIIEGRRFPEHDAPLANPYKVPRDGNLSEILEKYRILLRKQINNGVITKEYLCSLSGKNLGCWCKGKNTLDKECHGDVVVDFFKEYCL